MALMALMAFIPLMMVGRPLIVINGINGINGISSYNDVCLHVSEFFVISNNGINGINGISSVNDVEGDYESSLMALTALMALVPLMTYVYICRNS